MWNIGSQNKKSKKGRKKKDSGKLELAWYALVFIWRIIKTPAALSCLGLLAFCIWFKHSGDYDKTRTYLSNKIYSSQKASGMVLQNILLDGHKYTPKSEIIAAVTGAGENKIFIGYPIMQIDLWRIKSNLEKLTWVKHASVTRQLPSTLSIAVTERQPMALWQNDGKVKLIDIDGETINETNLEKFSNLIILVGSNVPYHAGHFLKFISSTPDIAAMISSGVLVNGRRWNVKLKNGILIKLPEDNPEEAWKFLTQKQQESKILESNVKIIDLRIEKKMYVK